ncbi:hypothetical protein [Pseudomonas aeruginosa]|uniref:hypothetical protein n=1 Tax=Pseudomonas aeruginosa TaxID=287 RepID=UPI000940A898|nr:hypothetical protein [Pseudomonas aeruginosa]MCO3843605.1 hypothetical protein [Pseudomonas aeruginosa]NPW39401.1 hypothetical protein [Pseudomonas aeruginosa]HBP1183203.1 hypothetical protein [Pseudomonas aeruginosa]HCF2456904.1 hypothetical protein [Pseudomonas aeruginosa]HEP8173728.1 hypothetical protein [Pseudomonas aeruginosa]
MGMDVFGKAPTSETGEYFRNNVWWWHPLWRYCEAIAPDLIPDDNLGHSNDGWGLEREEATELAARLERAIATGETERYAEQYRARLEALPSEPCTVCGGVGKRAEPPKSGPGQLPCNACDGTGRVLNFATHYPFAVDNVKAFAEFLRGSGGFQIC